MQKKIVVAVAAALTALRWLAPAQKRWCIALKVRPKLHPRAEHHRHSSTRARHLQQAH